MAETELNPAHIAYIILESFTFVVGVSGNLLSIYCVLAKGSEKGTVGPKNKPLSMRFILNIAIANLLLGAVAIPSGVLRVSQLK